jgi:hypothetical protein
MLSPVPKQKGPGSNAKPLLLAQIQGHKPAKSLPGCVWWPAVDIHCV